ncbi:MAG: hypothetical protein NTV61_07770 [Candidatus Bathyarchaeota archaeon]|nr:hypothetical protein [Candidatus Bathyarchaeota archaeon]
MPKKKCFIIMPFSETTPKHTEVYWESHFENFLKPIIQETGDIEVFKSDAIRGDILKKIILDLSNSDIVVADLTDSNPNVYWELGIRHSLKNGTITIKDIDYKKRVFDVSTIGTINYYPKDYIKNEKFKKLFKKAIIDCCENTGQMDSYVLDMLSGRGSIYEIINKEEIKRKIEGLVNEYTYNQTVYNEMMSYSQNNLELRATEKKVESNTSLSKTNIKFTLKLIRTNSLELLITTRYIDENIKLYNELENMLSVIYSINSQAIQWYQYLSHIESWLINCKSDFDKDMNNYKQTINYLIEKYVSKK